MPTEVSTDRWHEAAGSGSPDFLIHLHQGEVTWSQLWAFYRERSPDPTAVLALAAFFHAALSRAYDDEGGVLDRDGRMYPQLREWACFAATHPELLPEDRLRLSLAGLLGLGLVSALYYELVFAVYLEACLERQWDLGLRDGAGGSQDWTTAIPLPRGRLPIRWTEWQGYADGQGDGRWVQSLSARVEQHYAGWNDAYSLALGDEAGERFDEGGQG